MSPALNGSSALQHVELGDVLEQYLISIRNCHACVIAVSMYVGHTNTYHPSVKTHTLVHTNIYVVDRP